MFARIKKARVANGLEADEAIDRAVAASILQDYKKEFLAEQAQQAAQQRVQ